MTELVFIHAAAPARLLSKLALAQGPRVKLSANSQISTRCTLKSPSTRAARPGAISPDNDSFSF
jgi:hypothetical protein